MTAMLFCMVILIYGGCRQINGLLLRSIEVPEVVDFEDTVTLTCSYFMENSTLNSVKWYKDNREFFRYAPLMFPSIMNFPLQGITISKSPDQYCDVKSCCVKLEDLEQSTSGQYRCEISGDAPEFKLVHAIANMTIAALPKENPIISGIISKYKMDDIVNANCTSDFSNPIATLTWYINDEVAPKHFTNELYGTIIENDHQMPRRRVLELNFQIDGKYFISSEGFIKFRCEAKINSFSTTTRDSTVTATLVTKDDLDTQKLTGGCGNHQSLNFYSACLAAIIILKFLR